MHDPENRTFPARLELARKAGLAAAGKVKTADDYAGALGAFNAVLSDGHALLAPEQVEQGKAKWPGFTAAWRGERLYVAEGTPGGGIAAGAEILGCDGRDPRALILARTNSRGLRAGEPGRWWAKAPEVFVDAPRAAPPRPQQCRFGQGGKSAKLTLRWSDAPDDLYRRLSQAADGGYTDIGLSEPRPGLFLIGMPTFQVSDEGAAAYRKLYSDIAARRDELRSARAIVIDLRFNEGGSSLWSRNAGRALWGKEAVDTSMAAFFRPVQVWWRASEGNTAYLAELEQSFRKDGHADIAGQVANLAGQMRAALAAGQPFVIEADEEEGKQASGIAATDLATPVYVITPGRCASACLDAVDVFKRFPQTRLIGAPTSADSQYMEVRRQALPSGHGTAVIPNKVWQFRPRKGGEVYMPDIPMTQFDWSTAAFLDRIEAELGRGAPGR